MNKYTIIIYAIIVGAAVVSSVMKKRKKAMGSGQVNQNKPESNTPQKPKNSQPKTLEDILQGLFNEQKTVPVNKPNPDKTLVHSDKPEFKSTTLLEEDSLETIEEDKYYGYDTEVNYKDDVQDYDEMADHHVHGLGFDTVIKESEVEEEGEWVDIDWKRAIVSAEILRRPEY